MSKGSETGGGSGYAVNGNGGEEAILHDMTSKCVRD
jgi:hypothetical protein